MAMFGCDAKVGLSSSTLPTEILGRLQSEEELLALNIPQTSTSAQSSCDDDDQQTVSTPDLQDQGLQLEGTLPDTGASRYESSEHSPNQSQGNGETTETIQKQSEGEPESVQQDTVMGDLDQRHVNIHSERNLAQTRRSCNCSGHKKCQTNRCKCFKNKVKCSSRCHNSLNCKNLHKSSGSSLLFTAFTVKPR